METAVERRVAFGLGECEPTLRVVTADGLMNIYWGEVPHNFEAEHQLSRALENSGIHAWLQSLYHDNEGRLRPTSTLSGPCYGAWTDCPADIGEEVVTVMETFIREAMTKIVPLLGRSDAKL